MAVKTKTMFFADCDKCGIIFANECGGTFFTSEERLLTSVEKNDWQIRKATKADKQETFCPNHKK